jgi:glycerol uptake facilitator-like aquaporin
VAIGDKNFAGPAAIGITLAAAALTALPYTGAALNPARTLGPAIVFGCGAGSVRTTLLYVLAQLLGGLAAGAASWPLYGGWRRGRLSISHPQARGATA